MSFTIAQYSFVLHAHASSTCVSPLQGRPYNRSGAQSKGFMYAGFWQVYEATPSVVAVQLSICKVFYYGAAIQD